MKVLVTGGAGYIGSHVVMELSRQGYKPIIYDNLSKGHRQAITAGQLVVGEILDTKLLGEVMAKEEIEAVIHLAADSLVGESVRDPAKYFQNNISGGLSLLEAVISSGVKYFVFSSTAAVYGEPEETPITEEHPKNPTNPYGFSKLTVEGILEAYEKAYGLRFISLRYFNAAGADPEGRIGEDHRPETHLIPIVLQTALGQRESLELYGTDYPTPDGTCLRDYIHVTDLAQAHLLALKALSQGGDSACYNLGNGEGYSNRQVIKTVEKVTGRSVSVKESPRRQGDPAVLVASSAAIRENLGWRPQYPELEQIVETAWNWHRKYPEGFED